MSNPFTFVLWSFYTKSELSASSLPTPLLGRLHSHGEVGSVTVGEWASRPNSLEETHRLTFDQVFDLTWFWYLLVHPQGNSTHVTSHTPRQL